MNQANGPWSENALSYDCRSMLFKALHNMIEKYEKFFLEKKQNKDFKWTFIFLDIYYLKVLQD